jgi:predicted RNA-binding Zn-ribbon protein involved in translation (DUF1610 family)
MKLKKLSLAIVLVLFCFTASVAQQSDSSKVIMKTEYTCSMHPEIISIDPGYCPKCGMKLIEREIKIRPETLAQTYTCSMHPEVISDKPGKCPKCGMNLILKGDSSKKHKGCMGMMGGEMGHPARYFAIGVVAMVAVMMLFVFR